MNQKITFCQECTQLEPQKVQDSETTQFKWDLNWAKSLPCLPPASLSPGLCANSFCTLLGIFSFFLFILFRSHIYAYLGKKTLRKKYVTPKEVPISPLKKNNKCCLQLHLHGFRMVIARTPEDQAALGEGQMIYRAKQL